MGKGTRTERELVRTLEDDYGWAALRAGASGAATDRDRPDVLAVRERVCPRRNGWAPLRTLSECVAIELKAAADGRVHLDGDEIDALRAFADRAGADAYVVVKPDLRSHDHWHVFALWELHRTDGGNYSVREADLPGDSLADAFGRGCDR